MGRVITAANPLYGPIEIAQGVIKTWITVGEEAKRRRIGILPGAAAVGTTLFADRSMQEAIA